MKIINIPQGTIEWMEWRSNGIGASDIGTIMEVNPYQSPLMLYRKKNGFSESQVTNAMNFGKNQEAFARSWLEEHFDVKLDNFCAEDEENSFIKVSFDAINLEKGLLIEIKAPYSTASLQKMKDGDISADYECQLQWQMMISGINKAYLAVWDGQECILKTFEADIELQQKMKEKAAAFWNDLRRGIEPKPSEKDYIDLSNEYPEDWKEKVERYKQAAQAKAEADKVLKELKPQFEKLGDNRNFLLHDLKMTLCSGKESLDKNAMRADGIEMDRYMKVGNPYYRPSFK